MTASNPLAAIAGWTHGRAAATDRELAEALSALGARWSVVGDELVLKLGGPMKVTGAAAAFAGALADELDHHPDIAIAYAGLTLSIHTHDAKAITPLDLAYAARLETWLRAGSY